MIQPGKIKKPMNVRSLIALIRESEDIPRQMIIRIIERTNIILTASYDELILNPRFAHFLDRKACYWRWAMVSPNSTEWCLHIFTVPA